MIIKRSELYETLRRECPGKYSIGLHGISPGKAKFDTGEIACKIVKEGLNVMANRSINGTVSFFGRLDDPDCLEKVFSHLLGYWYHDAEDFIIVAAPVEMVCEDGRRLYVGATNLASEYKAYFGSQGDENSTVLDKIILAPSIGKRIDSKFILGRFRMLSEEDIELELNPNHLSKNSGIISVGAFNLFDEAARILDCFPSLFFDYSGVQEGVSSTYENLKKQFLEKPYDVAYLLETFEQLINEDKIRPFTDADFQLLEQLKAKQQKRYDEIKKYKSPNLSLEEIREVALNNSDNFSHIAYELRNDILLMRQLTCTSGLSVYRILGYLGEEVRNDLTAMLNLVKNCNPSTLRGFYDNKDYLGLAVRCHPIFWITLNARISQDDNSHDCPLFDIDAELAQAQKLLEEQQTTVSSGIKHS